MPAGHPLADPQAWINFLVMLRRVENKAARHNHENPRAKLTEEVKSKRGHRGKVKE